MGKLKCVRAKEHSRGFSLIEAIIAVGIMSVIGVAIVTFQKSVVTNSKVLQSTLISQQQVRNVLRTFSSELRSAVPSANGSYAIESIATTSIVFYANVDKDIVIERIRYFYATSTQESMVLNVLKRGIMKPVGTDYTNGAEVITTVVQDVKNTGANPIFTYYDRTYNGTASSTAPLPYPITIGKVRLVKLSLAVDPNAARSPVYQTYETQVSMRNLKDNL